MGLLLFIRNYNLFLDLLGKYDHQERLEIGAGKVKLTLLALGVYI